MHYTLVKSLTRSSKRDFCFSTFTMHRHHRLTFATLVMFMMIEAAPAVGQPFAKRRAFHQCSPISADAWLPVDDASLRLKLETIDRDQGLF
jgi:hypothetical protein